MRSRKTIKISYTALCTALFVVCSWIVVPISPPITLQALAVFVSVGVFGAKLSLTAYIVYLILGMLGLPVFAGFNGGIHVFVGPTGGFLIGFLFAIPLCGFMIRILGRRTVFLALSMSSGLIITYICGTVHYAVIWIDGPLITSVSAATLQCVVPFILPDILKIIAAVCITVRLKERIAIL